MLREILTFSVLVYLTDSTLRFGKFNRHKCEPYKFRKGKILRSYLPEPEETSKNDSIIFNLWTRENRDTPERERFTGSLNFKHFNASRENIILIHGYAVPRNSSVTDFFDSLHSVLLERDDFNVIGVDWSSLAVYPHFLKTLKHAETVGNITAKVIQYLRKTAKDEIKTFHIVAIEMGTLVAAVIGNVIEGKKVEKITGLDPTNLLVSNISERQRLSKESATLVEIIHTSGGFTGIIKAIGHRDFYPNGGFWPQPSCWRDEKGFCSVYMSSEYYGFSIALSYFKATLCSSYKDFMKRKCRGNPSVLLYNTVAKDELPEGKYYLDTTSWN